MTYNRNRIWSGAFSSLFFFRYRSWITWRIYHSFCPCIKIYVTMHLTCQVTNTSPIKPRDDRDDVRKWASALARAGIEGVWGWVYKLSGETMEIVRKSEHWEQRSGCKAQESKRIFLCSLHKAISTPELLSWLMKRRTLGNPETKCLLIGFREEQSKASLIGAFMLARGVSRRRNVQISNLWL